MKSPLEIQQEMPEPEEQSFENLKRTLPINIAKLPPLKSREISPRYNLAFKNHLIQLKERQKTPTPKNQQKQKENDEIRSFIVSKIMNEGSL